MKRPGRLEKATEIPDFKSEDEEFEFWCTHDAADLMDEGERVELDLSEARKAHDEHRARQAEHGPTRNS